MARRAEIESGEVLDEDSLSPEQWQFLMDHAGMPAPPPSDDEESPLVLHGEG